MGLLMVDIGNATHENPSFLNEKSENDKAVTSILRIKSGALIDAC